MIGATGCTVDRQPESHDPPAAGGASGCPEIASGGNSSVHVDYVDFVHANDTEYIAGLGGLQARGRPEIQDEQLTVRCSLSELNAETRQAPPPSRDGDAAFLVAGTVVYSVKGWSPMCRLAAKHDDRWFIYLAYQDNTTRATPKPCAVNQRHGR